MNILIIGFGGIGQRHFQSLYKEKGYNFYIHDKNTHILDEVAYKPRVEALQEIKMINGKEFELAIIATSNIGRGQIAHQILEFSKIHNLLIEKPICRSIKELNFLSELSLKTKIFCNYPCRYYPFWETVKKYRPSDKLKLIINGSDWGLACNMWHYLDLGQYLDISGTVEKIEWKKFSWIESKRDGFLEIVGHVNISFENIVIEMTHSKEFQQEQIIELREVSNNNLLFKLENNKLIHSPFKHTSQYKDIEIFQSQLTQKYFNDMKSNSCKLPQMLEVSYNTEELVKSIILASAPAASDIDSIEVNIS